MSTINFGIDLGTTNSAIAKFENGQVEVFKNPIGQKETLASVVAFRKERIIVGEKARELMEKDPGNVVGAFKRKMGTSDAYFIENLMDTVTPTDLSSYVLKELKNFVYTEESVDSVVITIPASFDTIQSNATKQAGLKAGFSEVVLLQEPVAASLAFVNRHENDQKKEGKWIVYDLGGGTFDVAIVKIEDGEMEVIDHQGDNFLGGTDFDNLIIEEIIAPYLEETGAFENILKQFKSASGRLNKLYFELLKKSEDVKVSLSGYESTEIEFEVEDDNGEFLDVYFEIKREEFNKVIARHVSQTVALMHKLLEDNGLNTDDLEEVLMIGGSTYIPYVRERIKEALGIEVNFAVDPTTAVAIGAAYFAGTKNKGSQNKSNSPVNTTNAEGVEIKMAYQKTSQQNEEYFTAKVGGDFEGKMYRIIRSDGGYDSGMKPLMARIEEDLALRADVVNEFQLSVYNETGDVLNVGIPSIEITQGKYGIMGQPLPADICIEIDQPEGDGTVLEVLFEKNALLPLKKTITKEINKTIKKGTKSGVFINILEGPKDASPSSNKPIGTIEITGEVIDRDLIRGSDVEITIEMTESRELKIMTYLMMTDQDFKNIFSPQERQVNINKLKDELDEQLQQLGQEVRDAEAREDFETAHRLKELEIDVQGFYGQLMVIAEDDVTDLKFQIEDRKRAVSHEIDRLTKDKKLTLLLTDLIQYRKLCKQVVDEFGEESHQVRYDRLASDEKELIRGGNKMKIESRIKEYRQLTFELNWKRPEYVTSLFHVYSIQLQGQYKDEKLAKQYIEKGEEALQSQNYDVVRSVISSLANLLPPEKNNEIQVQGTGLS